jgi:hypothetical protein
MGMMLEKIRLLVCRINDVEGRAFVVASALDVPETLQPVS